MPKIAIFVNDKCDFTDSSYLYHISLKPTSVIQALTFNGEVVSGHENMKSTISGQIKCQDCDQVVNCFNLLEASSDMSFLVTRCRCEMFSDKKDINSPFFYNIVVIKPDFSIVGRIHRNISVTGPFDSGLFNGRMIWSNDRMVVFRESGIKRLVRLEWSDLRLGFRDKWRYLEVHRDAAERRVADCWLGRGSDIAILWEDGSFVCGLANSVPRKKLLDEKFGWCLIKGILKSHYILVQIDKNDDNDSVDRANLFSFSKNTRKFINHSFKFPDNSPSNILDRLSTLHTSSTCATILSVSQSVSQSKYAHIHQFTRRSIIPIQVNIHIFDSSYTSAVQSADRKSRLK